MDCYFVLLTPMSPGGWYLKKLHSKMGVNFTRINHSVIWILVIESNGTPMPETTQIFRVNTTKDFTTKWLVPCQLHFFIVNISHRRTGNVGSWPPKSRHLFVCACTSVRVHVEERMKNEGDRHIHTQTTITLPTTPQTWLYTTSSLPTTTETCLESLGRTKVEGGILDIVKLLPVLLVPGRQEALLSPVEA